MIVKQTPGKPQVVIQDGILANAGDEINVLCLTAGSGAAANLVVRSGVEADDGDIIFNIRAPQAQTVCVPMAGPIVFENGAYVNLTGAGAYVSFSKL